MRHRPGRGDIDLHDIVSLQYIHCFFCRNNTATVAAVRRGRCTSSERGEFRAISSAAQRERHCGRGRCWSENQATDWRTHPLSALLAWVPGSHAPARCFPVAPLLLLNSLPFSLTAHAPARCYHWPLHLLPLGFPAALRPSIAPVRVKGRRLVIWFLFGKQERLGITSWWQNTTTRSAKKSFSIGCADMHLVVGIANHTRTSLSLSNLILGQINYL
jgi:hypothetical protein